MAEPRIFNPRTLVEAACCIDTEAIRVLRTLLAAYDVPNNDRPRCLICSGMIRRPTTIISVEPATVALICSTCCDLSDSIHADVLSALTNPEAATLPWA